MDDLIGQQHTFLLSWTEGNREREGRNDEEVHTKNGMDFTLSIPFFHRLSLIPPTSLVHRKVALFGTLPWCIFLLTQITSSFSLALTVCFRAIFTNHASKTQISPCFVGRQQKKYKVCSFFTWNPTNPLLFCSVSEAREQKISRALGFKSSAKEGTFLFLLTSSHTQNQRQNWVLRSCEDCTKSRKPSREMDFWAIPQGNAFSAGHKLLNQSDIAHTHTHKISTDQEKSRCFSLFSTHRYPHVCVSDQKERKVAKKDRERERGQRKRTGTKYALEPLRLPVQQTRRAKWM